MKKAWFVLIFCLPVQLLFSQEQQPIARQADAYYLRYEYARAAGLYKQLASGKKADLLSTERLADCYRKMNAYKEAAHWYGKLLTMPGAQPEDILYYGDMLKSQGKYTEATAAYNQYAAKTGQSPLVANRISGCDNAVDWISHPTEHTLSNLRILNSGKSDWGAIDYQGGIVFITDSLRTELLQPGSYADKQLYGRNKHSFYKIYLADSSFYGNLYLKDLSATFNQNRHHVGPIVFNNAYNTAYFTVNDPERKTSAPKEKYKGGIIIYGNRRLELLISYRDSSGRWGDPVAFPYNKPAEYSLGHAALSNDGRILYFTSDMPGGQGGTDIWYSEQQANGTWGVPQNCGTAINTLDDEAFPTMGADDNLYYSSKGKTGMGGFDIFKSTGARSAWSEPENLRYPINSPGDDFFMTTRADGTGFLSSNRPGGRGDDDIYTWKSITPLLPPYLPVAPLQILLEITVCPAYRDVSCVYLYNRQREIGWCFVPGPDGKIYTKLERESDYVIRTGGSHDTVAVSTHGIKSDMIQQAICSSQSLYPVKPPPPPPVRKRKVHSKR